MFSWKDGYTLVKKQGALAAIVRATSKTRPVVGPVLVL